MNFLEQTSILGLQPFEPDTETLHTLDSAARLAQLPRHTVLVYIKEGLLSPLTERGGGYYFDDEMIRTLRWLGHLHEHHGINLTGIRMIVDLLREVDRLREEVRSRAG
jgi:DNA-binding transcriptional MerR regulator